MLLLLNRYGLEVRNVDGGKATYFSFELRVAFVTRPLFWVKRIDSLFGKLLYCSYLEIAGSVAQLVEQRPFKP